MVKWSRGSKGLGSESSQPSCPHLPFVLCCTALLGGGCSVCCSQGEGRCHLYLLSDIGLPSPSLGFCNFVLLRRPVLWEANNLSLTWKDQLSGKSISTIMDSSNGGSWLQVFQSAIYRCFVQQELMAQFNSKVSVDPLKFLVPEKSKQQPEAEKTRKENANSVLKGLNVMMLVGTVLTVLGCLFKQFRFSQSRKRNKMFLVK